MEMQRHILMHSKVQRERRGSPVPVNIEIVRRSSEEKSKEMQIIFCTALTDFLVSTPFSVSLVSWGSHDLLTLSHYSLVCTIPTITPTTLELIFLLSLLFVYLLSGPHAPKVLLSLVSSSIAIELLCEVCGDRKMKLEIGGKYFD